MAKIGIISLIIFVSSQSFAQGSVVREGDVVLTYLETLNIEVSKYQYIVFYPLYHSKYADHHWVDQFLNIHRDFNNIVFIVSYNEEKELNRINDLNRKFIYVDRKFSYIKQSFYSYFPTIYIYNEGKIVDKYDISTINTYELKVSLYKKLKR